MKRDMDLCRSILILMEEDEAAQYGTAVFDINDVSEEKLHYHFMLLKQAGFITAANTSTAGGLHYRPQAITWQGHEFLSDVRSDTIWSKTKETALDKVGNVSLTVLQELAKSLVKTTLGLP